MILGRDVRRTVRRQIRNRGYFDCRHMLLILFILTVTQNGICDIHGRKVNVISNPLQDVEALVHKVSRGGSEEITEVDESTIMEYLTSVHQAEGVESSTKEQTPAKKFYVQGWRWHTLSFVRDARRLEKLALRILPTLVEEEEECLDLEARKNAKDSCDDDYSLKKAVDHVIGFNMKGLHRVEKELFMPWVREKLCTNKKGISDARVKRAFCRVADALDAERTKVAKIADVVVEQALVASSPGIESHKRKEAVLNVAQMSAALATRVSNILEKENRLIVPAVAAVVPRGEQQYFNKRVILKLGVFDSRVHLVGMHDAVWECEDDRERDEFKESIPALPRMMINRWKKQYYLPQAGILED